MRLYFFLAAVAALILIRFGNLPAQDNNNPPPAPKQGGGQGQSLERMLAFLSADDRNKFLAVRAKAFQDNPDLKAEDDTLAQGRPGPDASQEDRQAFREKMMAHMQKLRAAMLKEDPSVQSIFDQIDKHMSEMRAQRQNGGSGGGPGGGAPPPAGGNTPPPAGN